MRNNEIENETNEIKKWEDKTKRGDLKYKTKNYTYSFQKSETIRSFGDNTYTGKTNLNQAEMYRSNLF